MPKYEIEISLKDLDRVKSGLRSLGDDGAKALRRLEDATRGPTSGGILLRGAIEQVKEPVAGLASSIGPIGSAMSAVGAGGLAAAAGIAVVGLAMEESVRKAKETLEAFDNIGDAAERVGMSTKSFQEWKFAGTLSGIGAEATEGALAKLTKTIGEAVAGGKEAKEVFDRLGVSIKDQEGNVRTTESVLDDLTEKFASLENPAERAAAASTLFGKEAGSKMAAMLHQGSEEIAKMRKEANDLGVVIDDHMIREAGELNDKLDALTMAADANLKRAFVSLGPILVDLAGYLAVVAEKVASVVDAFRDLEHMSTRGLRSKLDDLKTEREKVSASEPIQEKTKLVAKDNSAMNAFFGTNLPTGEKDVQAGLEASGANANDADALKFRADKAKTLADLDAKIADVERVLNLRDEEEAKNAPKSEKPRLPDKSGEEKRDPVEDYLASLRAEVEMLGEEEGARKRLEATTRAELAARQRGTELTEQERTQVEILADVKAESEYGDKAGDWERDQQNKLRELSAEGSQRERIKLIIDAENRAREYGHQLTDEERAKIVAYADAVGKAEDASKKLEESQREMRQLGQQVGSTLASGLEDAIFNAKSLSDALGSVAKSLAKIALTAALSPVQTGISSWFGGLFGSSTAATTAVVKHSGGFGAESGETRLAAASLWSGAPRYHSGRDPTQDLRSGEIAAIIRGDEGVFTPSQMNNADSLLSSALSLAVSTRTTRGNVTIHAPVTVNPTGNQSYDDAMGRRTAKVLSDSLRGVIRDVMIEEHAPGGLFYGGNRGFA